MSLYDDLTGGQAQQGPVKHPQGYEPGLELAGDKGTAVVSLPTPGATEEDLLRAAGFDPDEWAIAGPIHYRKWMRYDQEWLHYYRFAVDRGKESPHQRQADVDELVGLIRSPQRGTQLQVGGDDTWIYVASDWQIGKGDGDGTAGTVRRVLASIEQAKERVRELRRIGRRMPHGLLACTGDLGEGTCGFYPNQPFLVDLNRREQNRTCRELLAHAIDELRPFFEDFTVATVGGNHGELRNDGKKATDNADNDDVAFVEAVKEAFDRAGSDVTWVIPHDELSICLDLAGVKVGFTHGHLFSRGGTMPQAKALEWWKGQVFGLRPVADAQILVSSHFHHYSVINHGIRTHFQTPAMDPGSRWFSDSSGSDSHAGVLTFRVDPTELMGWTDQQLLTGYRD